MKQEVLSQVFSESNKTYGIKSKPRDQEPTMFQMLQWPDGEEPWDFKSKNVNPQRDPESKLYPLRMAHEMGISEVHDQYRKITKLPDGSLVQDVNPSLLKIGDKSGGAVQGSPSKVEIQQMPKPTDYHADKDYNPKNQTLYRDQYQVKDIKNYNDLVEQLEQNCKEYKGKYKQTQQQTAAPDPELDNLSEKLSDETEELEDASTYQKKQSTRFTKRAKKLDPKNPEDRAKLRRRKDRIKKMKATTRWMPNTSFTTYFGKPSWGPYGYQNVNPTVGGICYGQHMLTHNVQPHRNENHPEYVQSYNNALRFAKSVGEIIPEPPRNCKEEDRLNPKQVDDQKKRNPLTATTYEEAKKQIVDTKGRQQVTDMKIKKPDLMQSMRFASEEGSMVEQAPKDNKSKKEKSQKSKKVGFQNKQNQKPPQQPILEDSLAIPDKTQKKFIEEMKQKKEYANRLAPKVNEIDPNTIQQAQSGAAPKRPPSQPNADLEDLKNIDDMNPPHMYLSNLQKEELDPKNYKNIPVEWLHRIPFAGRKYQPGLTAKDCFDFGY